MSTRSTVALAAALGLFAPSAYANTLVYNDTTATGNTAYPLQVADNFKVAESNVVVYDLAVFDTAKTSPIAADLYVGLYNDTTNSVVIGPVDFKNDVYNGTGGSYFVTEAVTPVALIKGDIYSVEAWGFGGPDLYYSGPPSAVTFNGSPLLTNLNGGDNITAGTLCNMYTGGNCSSPNSGGFHNQVANSWGAGSLVVGQTPIPAAFSLFATGLGVMGLFGRRRQRKNAAIAAA